MGPKLDRLTHVFTFSYLQMCGTLIQIEHILTVFTNTVIMSTKNLHWVPVRL